MTAWLCNDREALTGVVNEAAATEDGYLGLVLGLLSYNDWLTKNTGPLTNPPGQEVP
jgi:hypothetical protein